MFAERGVQQRVNYSALDVEELGSVYESLLDFQPVIEKQESGLAFDLRVGSERKTTGSYYTRPELVRELIQSALVPVMEDRLKEAGKLPLGAQPDDKKAALEKAILGITVCDPACGSGHFLLEAARRLGRELARIRTGEDEPSLEQFHLGVRDAVSHCIYGVDLNPLAVDLCKLALWLEGHWTGKPLSFLDHRIKCGNSLVGVFDLETLKQGIPDDAFNPVTGDDKKAAQAIKKRNRRERESPTRLLPFGETALGRLEGYAEQLRELADIAENNPADVRRKSDLYRKVHQSPESERAHRAADLWTAAFFVPLKDANDPAVPTHAFLMEFLERPIGARPQLTMADNLKLEHHFFHWPLEFPEVFAAGGFDVVLGNPPWERIKLQEDEFFATLDPAIANAPNKVARRNLIRALPAKNPALAEEFENAKHSAEAGSKFVRLSGRFPLTAVGDVNTYALFAEVSRQAVASRGSVGLLLPIGIATDETTKEFFWDLAANASLARLIGFENESFIFPAVHHSYKFCALTFRGAIARVEAADLAFFCRHFNQIEEKERHFRLDKKDLVLFNPNTRTCPVFRSFADAELTRRIYERTPVMVNEETGKNAWGARFMRVFDMNKVEVLEKCKSIGQLESIGLIAEGNHYGGDGKRFIPVYESKLMHHFDHRWASYAGVDDEKLTKGKPGNVETTRKADAALLPVPRWWMEERDAVHALGDNARHKWLMAFRNITTNILERTMTACIIPFSAPDFSIRLLHSEERICLVACLLGNLNSLVFDYTTRQSLAGFNLSDYITKQLPVIPPDAYSNEKVAYILPRILELVYTAWDVMPFADDLWRDSGEDLRELIRRQWQENKAATGGHDWNPPEWAKIAEDGIPLPPFKWDEDRRAQICAELDAYYALLYGLTRVELRYILDPKDVYGPDFPSETFRVLKEKEEKRFGEYRTRRLVLAAFDELSRSERFRGETRECAMTKKTWTVGE